MKITKKLIEKLRATEAWGAPITEKEYRQLVQLFGVTAGSYFVFEGRSIALGATRIHPVLS